jgi:hypothetical protein
VSEPLLPLPELPVRRETYCGQATVNQVTHYLVQYRPELLDRMLLEDLSGTNTGFSEAAWELLDELQPQAAELGVPTTPLGRLDLVCELSRRLRRAYGRKDRRTRGRALSENPQRLPPLCAFVAGPDIKKWLTQTQVDDVLTAEYAARPELWYAVAEEYRVDLRLDATSELQGILRAALLDRVAGNAEVGGRAWFELFHEAIQRIIKMCGLDGQPLAVGPGQKMPPLIEMDLYPSTVALGLTPAMVNLVLRDAYRSRPDLWCGTGEWARGLAPVDAQSALRQLLGDMWVARYPEAGGPAIRQAVFSEAYRRIYRMCGMED